MTPEQLVARRKSLGASEIGAVVGVNPYRNAHSVWASKVLGEEEAGNEETRLGSYFEQHIIDYYGRTVDDVRPNTTTFIGPEVWMSATPDGFSKDGGVVEVKLIGPSMLRQWGPQGSTIVPLYYACQVQWQMMCLGVNHGTLIMNCGTTFRYYRLGADADAQRLLLEYGRKFWMNHVVTGVMPPVDGSDECAAALGRLYGGGDRDVVVADLAMEELARGYFEAKKSADRAKDELTLAVNRIKEAIGDKHGIDGMGWKARWSKTKAGHRVFTMREEKDAD